MLFYSWQKMLYNMVRPLVRIGILLSFLFIQNIQATTDFSIHPGKEEHFKKNNRNGDRIIKKTGTDTFAPGIALIKTGDAVDPSGAPSCSTIRYTYTVTNESTEGEALENVVVTDDILGILPGPPIGDLNNNDILDFGETWSYSAFYDITPQNIEAEEVISFASVEANLFGQPDVEVSDLSDPVDVLGDEPTVVNIRNCKPQIALRKTSEAIDAAGGEGCDFIIYTFEVLNQGEVVLENVTLTDAQVSTDPIPGPGSGDINNNGLLDPNELWTYTAQYPITQGDINAGEVINQAMVEANVQGQPNVIANDVSDDDSFAGEDPTVTNLIRCQEPQIALVKTSELLDLDNDTCFETIRYTFEVTNEGNVDLTNVVLTDPLFNGEVAGPDEGDIFLDGVLGLDEVWIYQALYAIQQVDIDNGEVINQAQVVATNLLGNFNTSDDSDDNSVLEDDATVTIVRDNCDEGSPSIALIKESELLDLDNDGCNETIQYTFIVDNTGDIGLEEVVLEDPLFSGNIPGPILGDDNDGILGPDETWVYGAVYNVTPEDIIEEEVVNQAIVSAKPLGIDGNVQDLSDDDSFLEDDPTITIVRDTCDEGAPDIAMIKEGILIDADADGCEDSIRYTFIVDNTGDVDLQDVKVEDNELFTEDIPGPESGDENNNGILETNETWTYIILYDILQEDIDLGQVVNQAQVSANPINANGVVLDLSDDDSFLEDGPTITPVKDACDEGAPSIALIKQGILIDLDGDGCEESIRYTFIVDNIGDVDLEGVKVEDNELFSEDIPGPESGDDNNNGILETDETWTYIMLYTIVQDDIDSGEVINQAQVSASPINDNGIVIDLSDDDSFLEDEPTVTQVGDELCDGGSASIALIKQGLLIDLDEDGCDETIQYTFTVVNTGDIDLEEVVLADEELFSGNIPGPQSGDDNNNDILETDETWTYLILYDIVQSDIDQGEVTNQAQVNASPVNNDGQVLDLSDDDSFLEDDKTVTEVGDELCDNGSASIALIKQGLLIDLDEDGCNETIQYTFTVVNTGDIDLEEVVLADEELFSEDIPGPQSGDDNNNDVLETDETWIYIVLYDIEQDDINLGQVTNQAQVNASPINNDGIVLDTSDDDSFLEDDKTVTLVGDELCTSGSASIALIKQGVLVDLDEDGCNEAIQYTFTVENTGDTNLEEVVLEDNDLFSEDIQGPESGDDNNNGILEPNETWTYVILYNLVQQDVDNGEVINQAQVHASPVDNNGIVLDPSDDDSFLEDDPTVTLLEDVCDENGNALGLIKTSILVDLDNDGCFDSIEYTFTLENTGSNAIQGISLEDQLFGGIIPGPQSGDEENDNILDVGEIWTYLIFYDITQADIDIGQVVNQAKVSGIAIGNNNPVEDLSDDDSYLEDDPTITDVQDACNTISTGIGLIKQGVFVDLDNDDCEETIRYDFTVANLGDTDLENVQLSDELLGGVLEGLIISSESEDEILQAGETWQYSAVYEVAQQDIDMGSVPNQATVVANPVGSDAIVFDFSDDNSFLEDDITILETSDLCDSGSEGIIIYNGITPNGDGSNDYFQIIDIENFPNNTVQIFNRWGVLVYETDNYGQGNNVFRGISEGRLTIAQDRNLPSGTYFYIITFPEENPGKPRYNGYLYINRN